MVWQAHCLSKREKAFSVGPSPHSLLACGDFKRKLRIERKSMDEKEEIERALNDQAE
jgi:hypothetical protein